MAVEERTESLAESLHQQLGSGLRGVLSYRATGEVEVHHVRDDIDQKHTENARDEQIQEFIMETLAADIQEQRFSLGSLGCTAWFFDDATVLNFISDGDVDVVISLEPGAVEINRKFITRCQKDLVT